MSLAIIGDSIRESENGLEVTIYVARGSHVEFGAELGGLQESLDSHFLYSYLKRQYKGQFFNKVRLVQEGRYLGCIEHMELLLEQSPGKTDSRE